MERDSQSVLKTYILIIFQILVSVSEKIQNLWLFTSFAFPLISLTVLGFGLNAVTIVIIVVFGFTRKSRRGIQRSDAQVVADLVGL